MDAGVGEGRTGVTVRHQLVDQQAHQTGGDQHGQADGDPALQALRARVPTYRPGEDRRQDQEADGIEAAVVEDGDQGKWPATVSCD